MMVQVSDFKNNHVAPCGTEVVKSGHSQYHFVVRLGLNVNIDMIGVHTMVLDDGESIKITFRVVGPLVFQESLI